MDKSNSNTEFPNDDLNKNSIINEFEELKEDPNFKIFKERNKQERFNTKMNLATRTLIILVAIFFVFCFLRIFYPTAESKEVFGILVTVIPPLITLILGYYFGNRKG